MRRVASSLALAVSVFASAATAQSPASPPPTPLRVIAFDGGWNLPIWAGQRQGFFEANGVAVQLSYTPSSAFLVQTLFDGKSDIATAAIDNLIAYQEGQGEAKIPDDPDLFAFIGCDSGFATVVSAPALKTFADLKGKTISVDAMTTGYAFVVRELVTRNGLAENDVSFVRAGGTANRYKELLAGKHDATLLRTPFELLARNKSFNILAGAESLGAYQGTVAMTRRSWARDHEAALVGFIRAYAQATEWLYDRGNRDIVEALLVANIRDMTPALAKQAYDILLADKNGLYRNLAPDVAGIRTVLELRSKFGLPKKTLTDPAKYVDLSYYEKASAKR
jgi:ABC-type nitrate/sulfonate/bicarbonate transport system substrate-binding protein